MEGTGAADGRQHHGECEGGTRIAGKGTGPEDNKPLPAGGSRMESHGNTRHLGNIGNRNPAKSVVPEVDFSGNIDAGRTNCQWSYCCSEAVTGRLGPLCSPVFTDFGNFSANFIWRNRTRMTYISEGHLHWSWLITGFACDFSPQILPHPFRRYFVCEVFARGFAWCLLLFAKAASFRRKHAGTTCSKTVSPSLVCTRQRSLSQQPQRRVLNSHFRSLPRSPAAAPTAANRQLPCCPLLLHPQPVQLLTRWPF